MQSARQEIDSIPSFTDEGWKNMGITFNGKPHAGSRINWQQRYASQNDMNLPDFTSQHEMDLPDFKRHEPNVDPRSLPPGSPGWYCRECGGGGIASTSRGGAYFCNCGDGAAALQRHNESGNCQGCGIHGCQVPRNNTSLEESIKYGPGPGDSGSSVSTPSPSGRIPPVDNRRRIGPFRINTEGFYRGK